MTEDLFDNEDASAGLRFGPVIMARYEGTCAACGWDIRPGDDIRADGQGEWIHADDDCERIAR